MAPIPAGPDYQVVRVSGLPVCKQFVIPNVAAQFELHSIHMEAMAEPDHLDAVESDEDGLIAAFAAICAAPDKRDRGLDDALCEALPVLHSTMWCIGNLSHAGSLIVLRALSLGAHLNPPAVADVEDRLAERVARTVSDGCAAAATAPVPVEQAAYLYADLFWTKPEDN
jgi:hypothetical protein